MISFSFSASQLVAGSEFSFKALYNLSHGVKIPAIWALHRPSMIRFFSFSRPAQSKELIMIRLGSCLFRLIRVFAGLRCWIYRAAGHLVVCGVFCTYKIAVLSILNCISSAF